MTDKLTALQECLRDILLVAIGDRYENDAERKEMAERYAQTYSDVLLDTLADRTTKDCKEDLMSETLEAEIKKYFNALYSGWTKEEREKDSLVEEMCIKTARHFANWQKEQMMSKAFTVELARPRKLGQVHLCGSFACGNSGDKVKIVIIKE